MEFSKFCSYGTTIFNILDNTTELWMTKYIIGEIFSSGGATLHKNPSDQTVKFTFHYTQTIYMDITKKRKDPVIHIKCIYTPTAQHTCVQRRS